jgi:hypothetical protein
MAKVWLTYAWKDNADQDVDRIIHELRGAGLDVRFDRVELMAGRRVWEQLATAIADPELRGLILLATENSLASEPCQEELAYGLHRVLRAARGRPFDLIGLFPHPMDEELIPPSIATRLYVNLTDPTWKDQIAASLLDRPRTADFSDVTPFGMAWHRERGDEVLEVWPRTGAWAPAAALVPTAERDRLLFTTTGPRGYVTGNFHGDFGLLTSQDGFWSGRVIHTQATAQQTLHIFFRQRPNQLLFGSPRGSLHRLTF